MISNVNTIVALLIIW